MSSGNVSRRALLRSAAGVALAGVAGALDARAQVTGIMPEGGKVPFRLPMGALDFLDRKEYIHNMEIHAYLKGATITGGEPLMVMWAKGRQRMIPAGAGFIDVSEGKNPVLVETGSTRVGGCVAYNTTLKKWIMMSTSGRPLTAAGPGTPYGQYHEKLREEVLNFKGHRGVITYDVTNPSRPVKLQEFSTGARGGGTHQNFYDGGKYAYLDAGWDDELRMENAQRPSSNALMIVDMTDPANLKEVSRWWVPGQRIGEEAEYKKYVFAGDQASWTGNHGAAAMLKRVEDGGTVAYTGFGHFGMHVLDLSDVTKPKSIGSVRPEFETIGGIPYHTIYPVIADPSQKQLQNLVVAIPEVIEPDCREPYKSPHVVDVSDPRNPRIIGWFPRPAAPKDAPYTDFCFARGRFGPHNSQALVAPGASRGHIVAISYFTAGLRIFDISNPTQPKEVAWYVPPRNGEMEDYRSWFRGTAENMVIEWDRNLIWLGTHEGSYCLSTPALGKPILEPRKIERWTMPHFNAGWDDQTSASVYFGRTLGQIG